MAFIQGRGVGVGKQPGAPFHFRYRSHISCELPRFSLLCLSPSHLFPAAEDPGGWTYTERRSLGHTRDNPISLYTQVKQQGIDFSNMQHPSSKAAKDQAYHAPSAVTVGAQTQGTVPQDHVFFQRGQDHCFTLRPSVRSNRY